MAERETDPCRSRSREPAAGTWQGEVAAESHAWCQGSSKLHGACSPSPAHHPSLLVSNQLHPAQCESSCLLTCLYTSVLNPSKSLEENASLPSEGEVSSPGIESPVMAVPEPSPRAGGHLSRLRRNDMEGDKTSPLRFSVGWQPKTQAGVRPLLTGPDQAGFSAPQLPRCDSHLQLQQRTLTAHGFNFLQCPGQSKGTWLFSHLLRAVSHFSPCCQKTFNEKVTLPALLLATLLAARSLSQANQPCQEQELEQDFPSPLCSPACKCAQFCRNRY